MTDTISEPRPAIFDEQTQRHLDGAVYEATLAHEYASAALEHLAALEVKYDEEGKSDVVQHLGATLTFIRCTLIPLARIGLDVPDKFTQERQRLRVVNAHEVAEKLRNAAASLKLAADGLEEGKVEEGKVEDARKMLEVAIIDCGRALREVCELLTAQLQDAP